MKIILALLLFLVFNPVYGQEKIAGAIGVLKFEEGKDTTIVELANNDGTVWLKYNFGSSLDEIKEKDIEFHPFIFHPDYYLLSFKTTRILEDRYEVLVNDSTKKFISKTQTNLIFYKWKDYVVNAEVSISPSETKVFTTNDSSSFLIDDIDGDYLEPILIAGEWLKVKWYDFSQKEYRIGWVQWIKDGSLNINLGKI